MSSLAPDIGRPEVLVPGLQGDVDAEGGDTEVQAINHGVRVFMETQAGLVGHIPRWEVTVQVIISILKDFYDYPRLSKSLQHVIRHY